MTPSALEPIQEPDFRATGQFDDARLNVWLWGNADQRGNTLLDAFLQAADRQAVAAGIKEIVVDFRELEFMNSSCLKALVTWLRRAQEHRARAALRDPLRARAAGALADRSFSALAAFGRGVLTIE